MPRSVDEIELVQLAGYRLETQRHALGFDGDAALALQIHGVEHLGLHLACIESTAFLDEAIGQCRFAVVNMSNDGKIADILHLRREPALSISREPRGWATPALYRSAVKAEGLIHLLRV